MANFDGSVQGKLAKIPDVPDGGGKPANDDADNYGDIVLEAKERWKICQDAEDRHEAMEDLKFKKGEQWDADAIAQREIDNRPCLTFNNIPAILHQITNDARQNKQSIQVAPVDSGADIEVAKVLEGLIRHIEYDSDADAAYDTALDNAASIGFGFFRLVTEYVDATSFNQTIKIKRIRNPFTVHLDPNAQEADAHDMQYAFISARVPKEEFRREYPNAEMPGATAIGTAVGDNDDWSSQDFCRVAEYYRIEYTADTLVQLADGTTMLKSDPKWNAALQVTAHRPTQIPKVMWYKLTSAEVLEKAEVPGPWIPIFPVYGDEIDIDGTVTRNGIIRNAKSPKMMENYFLTAATEEIAMRTKTPFIGALGQFEGLESDWNQANVRNFSYLEYNPVSIEGALAPPPSRQAPADVPQGYVAMAQLSGDKVKAVTGIYDASLGNRSNEVSGLAIKSRQQQGEISNFHFSDNLTRAITRCAKCLIKWIPKIFDTERVERILGEDRKTAEPVELNKSVQQRDPKTGEIIQKVLNDLTVGEYDVTVSTGPAYNTMRQESAANLIELNGKWPKLMDVAGDLVVRQMDFPDAEAIADRIEKTLPPGLADDKDEQENMVQTPKGPVPAAQAGQLIGQMDHVIQQMQEELDKANKGIPGKQIDAESRERVAEINAQAKHDDTELAGMIELLLAGQANMASQLSSYVDAQREADKMVLAPLIDHAAQVDAAQDPDHPAAPAPIAQGMEQSPAEQQAAEQQPTGAPQ